MALHKVDVLDSALDSTAGHQSDQSLSFEKGGPVNRKARVIGLYGIPGSGKTFLLNQLKQELAEEHFNFYEGSEMIASLVPGGLQAFQNLDEQKKTHYRQLAIDTIENECTNNGHVAIVTGHFMFWPEDEEKGRMVYTQNDLATFTHVLYLDVPVEVIDQRCREDRVRSRSSTTTTHLSRWQQAEKAQLRRLCRDHGIMFSLIASDSMLLGKITLLLQDFRLHTEAHNLSRAESQLDKAMGVYQSRVETVLVIDADKTLAAEDTGKMFWERAIETQDWTGEEDPLKSLFSSPLGYSYIAFRQAMLLYEEAADDEKYEALCQRVASAITMHVEFVSLLRLVTQQGHIGAMVVSCGLRRVWEIVLEREGLLRTVNVIAGGRVADGFVVTAAVKAAMVVRLQAFYQAFVWAFGDSPLDLDMLKKADKAVVVVGDEHNRSKSMDVALSNTIEQDGLQAVQVTLPNSASPRLIPKLPVVQLTGIEFISTLLSRQNRATGLPIFLATDRNAAKLLATPMRDAAIAGPALREAHRRTGWYLATELVSHAIGIETCEIKHVLGHTTSGYRLQDEKKTTIVALMRAGEPMASGVSEAFPLAAYVHARQPDDIRPHHLRGRSQVFLVDGVVNSGKTIMEFVEAIRILDANVRIVVVAGVVQAQCVSPSSTVYKALVNHGNVSLIALRLSDTKFTGSGTTDTGNRLFNTTFLL